MITPVWQYSQIDRMHVELSTYCNAACPACPRTLQLTDGSSMPYGRPNLQLESISADNFQRWFPTNFMDQVKFWVFCGTHGDPMMNKDVLPIMEYVCQTSNNIVVNTNGGMRDTTFWKQLATTFSKNLNYLHERQVVFSLDGLEDTNHLYRRNVSFKKALENAKAFIDAGGIATWEFLIFEHNEHQVEIAKKLAFDLGFKYFIPKKALGFQNLDNIDLEKREQISGKICRDTHGNVEYIIHPPSRDNINFTGKNLKIIEDVNVVPTLKVETDIMFHHKEKIVNAFIEKKYNEIKDSYIPHDEERCLNIKCRSHNIDTGKSELYVDAYGNVFPCCYVGVAYNGNFLTASGMQLILETNKYGLKNINLKNYNLETIVNGGYLRLFESSWGKSFENGGFLYCNMTCGDQSSIDKIYSLGKRTKI